ncbi:hypothetical protein GAY33_05405 [Azospirillum brasilense]|uniref:ASCH domain-containing protein n=1 Tax=Azospirillum argentinense TaxID=2970906 RepID=UPI00190A96DD|nr:ASCH domain-containing protein [Azospirillum argentinense]MBK3798673.1 hypothetical protein [Azospirillum argentinense]
MVAYSFNKRFADPILAGLEPGPLLPGMKRQTIRADRKRHARPGEDLQLYTGMRTRSCKLLGVTRCVAVEPIRLLLTAAAAVTIGPERVTGAAKLDAFARWDGFTDFDDLRGFWRAAHPEIADFTGWLIRWHPT